MEREEYLVKLKKFLDETIREKIKSGIEVPESKYLDCALAHTKTLYKSDPTRRASQQRHFWSRAELAGIMEIWESVRQELEQHIAKTVMKYRSRRMVTEINAVSSEALVSEAMKEAGLKYEFFSQTYRAKVHVKISEKNKVVVYLNYKRIGEELPKAIEALKAIASAMVQLGTSSSIQKTAWYDNFK